MKPYDLPKSEWPEYLHQHPVLKGIYVGGCKYNHLRRKENQLYVSWLLGSFVKNRFWTITDVIAHAHTGGSGIICIPTPDLAQNKLAMIHEIAHLMVRDG